MNKSYLFSLILPFVVFSMMTSSIEKNQVAVSGVINNYGAVSGITPGSNCESILTVDDASGFSPGGSAWVIQMQGATINNSNSGSFGNVSALNSAGLHEKVTINNVSGNQITISALVNSYQIGGKVQIVSIAEYVDAEVTGPVSAFPWNGSKGGVLAMEVSGTLTLMADIDASGTGFRGGVRAVPDSDCISGPFFQSTDFYYPASSWEGERKGEGIAEYITGREAGKGPQANGGGGANDHNAGGGGGAGYNQGGLGGENPSLNCLGLNPGLGGKKINFTDNRIFLGGGGGAGHDNNDAGSDGGNGGGIIYISAGTIAGGNHTINASGQGVATTIGIDGGGGGGGGGVVILDAVNISSNFTVELSGGKGSDTQNNNQDDRCMGPGGGGGGGAIYTDVTSTAMTVNLGGGNPGVITNTGASCLGSSSNATGGQMGASLPFIPFTINPGTVVGAETYQGCSGDGYSVTVNNTAYNENNPTGSQTLTSQFGCDSVVTISLSFLAVGTQSINPIVCDGETFQYGNTVYDAGNSSGQEILSGASANGCDSIVFVNLSFYPGMNVSEAVSSNEVTVNVSGGTPPFTYAWSNGDTGQMNELTASGTYTVTVSDDNGCMEEHTFNFMFTSNEDIAAEYGIRIFPNPVKDFMVVSIDSPGNNMHLEITDAMGRTVYEQSDLGNESRLDLSRLPTGNYILRLKADDYGYSHRISIIR